MYEPDVHYSMEQFCLTVFLPSPQLCRINSAIHHIISSDNLQARLRPNLKTFLCKNKLHNDEWEWVEQRCFRFKSIVFFCFAAHLLI